ncbi:MAG: hypothetical protein R3Y60_01005 [bacterium]
MKKIFILLFFIISIFTANSAKGYENHEFDINWQKVYVPIPLNGNISDYERDFIVTVSVDGTLLTENVDYYVKVGVNGTSIGTITTNITGRYEVDVMVSLFKYNAFSENTVTYHVIDYDSPGFDDENASITTPYSVIPDYVTFYKMKNSDKQFSSISVNESFVKINYIGNYFIIVTATQTSGAIITETIPVYVVDPFPPRISLINPFEISIGEIISPSNYFTGYDDYDKDITNQIKIESYDSSKLGSQLVYVSLTDLSGNNTRIQVSLSVVDNTKPIVYFNTNDAKIDIEEDITYSLMQGFILSVVDDGVELDIGSVNIDFSSVLSELGTYSVTYSVEDENGNKGEYKLAVRVVQMRGPEIYCTNIIIKSGEVFDVSTISDYITVYDQFDSTAESTLRVDFSNVNLSSKGTYMVLVSACNSSGIFTYKTMLITVKGDVFLNLDVYWPLLFLLLAPAGYFGYQYYQKQKAKKFEENIL